MWGLENEEVADVLLEELQIFFFGCSLLLHRLRLGNLG